MRERRKKNSKAAMPADGDRRQVNLAEVLLDISRRVTDIESFDEILETLVEMTKNELDADRGTIFLNDRQTGELYSVVAQGSVKRQIRLLNTTGVAGSVFTAGEGVIINDTRSNENFNPDIDHETGYVTKSLLCAPIKTFKGVTIGVSQILNKNNGEFTTKDMMILEAMTRQASVALQSSYQIDKLNRARIQELKFLDVVSDITSEIELSVLLQKIMSEATRMLDSERSTLFLNDDRTGELWSEVAEGMETKEIRFPNHLGIAGTVYTTGRSVNIPHAYADLRFNPAFDRQTGFFTRSILCTPVVNKHGKVIGVTQVLNKRGGAFTDEDEQRLRAFTAQASIALENAKLFNDVQNMKNYNEGMLESMSNGVITLDENRRIVTCNRAGLSILRTRADKVIGSEAADLFSDANEWVMEKADSLNDDRSSNYYPNAELEFGGDKVSVNLTIQPLRSTEEESLGIMIVMEDISGEKRLKSTMSRYIDPSIFEQMMDGGVDILGGRSTEATILFSDIRGFTSLTEELGAQGTVSLLNDYFTIMVECIQREGGMLDKFIGDAIMAAFGIPISHGDDEDRALRAAISMIRELDEWNVKRAIEGKKPVNMGIGLNTDTIVSGNIGSPKRMDYTMIGDGVNLSARLESACKKYFARILISENTYNKLKGTYRVRHIDDVVVSGKTEPIGVFEVLDYHTKDTFPNLMEAVGYFNEGRNHYKGGDWDTAITSFKKALAIHPGDELTHTYISRCELMKKNPPEGDWKGIWIMKSK